MDCTNGYRPRCCDWEELADEKEGSNEVAVLLHFCIFPVD